jgi:hypothetical protein
MSVVLDGLGGLECLARFNRKCFIDDVREWIIAPLGHFVHSAVAHSLGVIHSQQSVCGFFAAWFAH